MAYIFCMKKIFPMLLLFMLVPFLQGPQQPLDPSNNAVWHNAMGLEYMSQGNVPGAISEYKIAIALKADKSVSSAFHNNLGIAYLKLGKPSWAVLCFENAISLNPNTFYFYENLVKAYAKAGRTQEQYRYFKRRSAENFENSYNWLMLGLIQERIGQRKNAVKSFQNYILLEPEIVVSQAVKTRIDDIKRAGF